LCSGKAAEIIDLAYTKKVNELPVLARPKNLELSTEQKDWFELLREADLDNEEDLQKIWEAHVKRELPHLTAHDRRFGTEAGHTLHESFLREITPELERRYREQMHQEKYRRTDELSGLLNKHAFAQVATRRLFETFEQKISAGYLMIDLINFKGINDRFSQLAGDQYIHETGKALLEALADTPGILIGRTGGDEFGIFIPNATSEQLQEYAQRINQHFATKHYLALDRKGEQRTIHLRAAHFGMAVTDPSHYVNLEELQLTADADFEKNKDAYYEANPHLQRRTSDHFNATPE
jgi:diguanylate cyclase (GGDEF)-like protein